MARPATGQVVVRKTQRGRVLALRFSAYGKRQYVTLGTAEEGWTRQKADEELANVLAAVRLGTWRPTQAKANAPTDPSFHEFASEWLANREPGLAPKTVIDYRWVLSHHLLPFFAPLPLSEIGPREVDTYKAGKLKEGRLNASQINKTLKLLAQIMDYAIEYRIIDGSNPARGKNRRVKAGKPQRTWVEPEQLMPLIENASRTMYPTIAILAGAGLRVGEAVALDWRDVNLATATLRVSESKTEAGTDREVDLPSGLVETLSEWKATTAHSGPGDPVLVARNGSRQSVSNVGRRLKASIKAANAELAALGIDPISEKVTPHSLRRTYSSVRAAIGDNPVYIAEQMGHEDATFTFRVYQKAVKRREKLSGEYLRAFDRALDWAQIGTTHPDGALYAPLATGSIAEDSAPASHNRTHRPR